MIKAKFYKSAGGKLRGFSVSGHAGLAESGFDVCCASVSSAVMLTANTITEAFSIKPLVSVEDDQIRLMLNEDNDTLDKILLGFLLHMQCLSEDFSGFISITILEV